MDAILAAIVVFGALMLSGNFREVQEIIFLGAISTLIYFFPFFILFPFFPLFIFFHLFSFFSFSFFRLFFLLFFASIMPGVIGRVMPYIMPHREKYYAARTAVKLAPEESQPKESFCPPRVTFTVPPGPL